MCRTSIVLSGLVFALGTGLSWGADAKSDSFKPAFYAFQNGVSFGSAEKDAQVALETLKTINNEKLLSSVTGLGQYFLSKLNELQSEY